MNIVEFPQKRFASDLEGAVEMHSDEKGVLDLYALEHTPAVAMNGTTKCDVVDGPCSCGAWHHKGDARDWTPEYIGYCRLNGKEPGQ